MKISVNFSQFSNFLEKVGVISEQSCNQQLFSNLLQFGLFIP